MRSHTKAVYCPGHSLLLFYQNGVYNLHSAVVHVKRTPSHGLFLFDMVSHSGEEGMAFALTLVLSV